jgi:hypothetical protein
MPVLARCSNNSSGTLPLSTSTTCIHRLTAPTVLTISIVLTVAATDCFKSGLLPGNAVTSISRDIGGHTIPNGTNQPGDKTGATEQYSAVVFRHVVLSDTHCATLVPYLNKVPQIPALTTNKAWNPRALILYRMGRRSFRAPLPSAPFLKGEPTKLVDKKIEGGEGVATGP